MLLKQKSSVNNVRYKLLGFYSDTPRQEIVWVPDNAHFMGSLETILGDALDPLEGGVRLLAALVQVGLQHQRLQHLHDLQHGGRMLKQE